jgi:hypothetical protein
MTRVWGLRWGSADQSAHHWSAQVLNGSWPRRRPCQVPWANCSRFSAARARAWSLLATVSALWEPSSSNHQTW